MSAGRKHAITKEDFLKAIHDHKTTSPAKLRKILKVGRATIYRYLADITQQEINAALGVVTETQLTPAEAEYDVFCQIPEIIDFYETLRYKREAGERYSDLMRRTLFRICVLYKVHPTALTLETAAEFIVSIKKGEQEQFGSGYDVRRSLRSWFGYRGVSTLKLTNIGIHARLPKTTEKSSRAKLRLTQEQRHRIREVARKKYATNWVSRRKNIGIPFADDPSLAAAMDAWFEFKYYTMTRLSATLKTTWETRKDESGGVWGVVWKADLVVIRIVDKGKRGGIPWDKKLIGQAMEHFKVFYERIGKPKSGRIFPFSKMQLRYFVTEVYKDAEIPESLWKGMPDHIWRHTGAQDLLDATGWNYAVVAATGGWENIEVLKRHYGEMPPSVQENAVRKAMGLPVVEEKREFVF